MTDIAPVKYTLEYPYTRTTGPVVGKFLTGLRDGKLFGIRCGNKVICPPVEQDPETGDSLEHDFVEVGPGGTIQAFSWIAEPTRKHPFQEPFAFALILPDGGDTPITHAVKGAREKISVGARVWAQYRDERVNAVTDVYFVPEADANKKQHVEAGPGEVEMTEHLISLSFEERMYPHRARFAKGLLEGKFIGAKSRANGKVYIPNRGYDPLTRTPITEEDEVELSLSGTVVGYTIITPVQYYGQEETEPYIRSSILLDGSDQPLGQQDIRNVPHDEFHVGLRMRAVFKPEGQRDISDIDNRYGGAGENVIDHWELTGEPDVDSDELAGKNW